jgi:putative heme-binding domain-containing protein
MQACLRFISGLRLFAMVLLVIVTLGVGKSQGQDESDALAGVVRVLRLTDDVSVQSALLTGMIRGLEGRRNVPAPQGWSQLAEKLATSSDPGVRELSTQLSQIFGDIPATERLLRVLQDAKSKPSDRRRALQALLAQKNTVASGYLEALMDHPDLRLDAIRGFAIVENRDAPAILLGRFREFNSHDQKAVVETLASRKSYATALLDALEHKKVVRDDIPVQVARSLNLILGRRFTEVYGEIKSIGADREQQINKYKKLITAAALETASAARGRLVFRKTCAACHLLYGEGGQVGPDLTGSNRANLDYILLNSVDPSYDVPEGYRAELISTFDGRLLTGVIAEEDANIVVLKTAEQPRVVVAKDDIENRKTSDKSMMPDGQLEQLEPQQLLDLIKYLRTTEQVELEQ